VTKKKRPEEGGGAGKEGEMTAVNCGKRKNAGESGGSSHQVQERGSPLLMGAVESLEWYEKRRDYNDTMSKEGRDEPNIPPEGLHGGGFLMVN